MWVAKLAEIEGRDFAAIFPSLLQASHQST
jgi:hypothetical protein